MPDRYRVRITPRASNDMVGICSYVQQDSPQNAAWVAQELLLAIDSLDLLPRRYGVRPAEPVKGATLWQALK